MSSPKTYGLIVTYSDRFHLVKTVIESCRSEGIHRILVVDNNSDVTSKEQLRIYESENRDYVKVIYLNENIGSSGGFKVGLQEIYKESDCDFIWLLDDDNKPEKGSFKTLMEFWKNSDVKDKNKKLALLSYREARTSYREAIMRSKPYLVVNSANSFLGFHIQELPQKVIRVLKRRMNKKVYKEDTSIRSGKIALAPYGGLFIHKDILEVIGYPDEKFFVYNDDHDWSYRITENKGAIYLLLDSIVRDIDESWDKKSNKESKFDILGKDNSFRTYYSVRNRIFFEKKYLITSDFFYKLNLYTFKFLYKIMAFLKGYKNKEVLDKAIRDGLNGVSGKTFIQ